MDEVFKLFKGLLKEMQAKSPHIGEVMLPVADALVEKDAKWRASQPPRPWTPKALKNAMELFKAERLRWDGLPCSSEVEACSDYAVGRGQGRAQKPVRCQHSVSWYPGILVSWSPASLLCHHTTTPNSQTRGSPFSPSHEMPFAICDMQDTIYRIPHITYTHIPYIIYQIL